MMRLSRWVSARRLGSWVPLQVGSVAARVAQLYLTDVLFHEVCRRHPDQCAATRQVVAEALSDKHI